MPSASATAIEGTATLGATTQLSPQIGMATRTA